MYLINNQLVLLSLFSFCALNPQSCWSHRNTGNSILDRDITHNPDEAITIRGRYVAKSHRGRNGFKFLRNGSYAPDIIIYNKDHVPQKGSFVAETIVKIKNSNDMSYVRYIFNESTYSQELDIIYQLTFNRTWLTLRINNNTFTIDTPSHAETGYWQIGHINQIGEATVVKEVNVCPHHVRSLILKQGFRVMDCVGDQKCPAVSKKTALLRSEVELSCLVTGLPPLLLWWSREERNITDGDSQGINRFLYQTQTVLSSKLTFVLDVESEGRYFCNAANKYDVSLRSTSLVSVSGFLPLTSYISEPKHVIAMAGSTVTFTCAVQQWPSGTQLVFWRYLDGKDLPSSYIVEKIQGGSNKEVLELELPNVVDEDSGVFTCGQEIASLYVETVVNNPEVVFSRSDEGVEVTCSSRATPPPNMELILHDHNSNAQQGKVGVTLKGVVRSQGVSTQTWKLDTAIKYYKVLFYCIATQVLTNRTKTIVETSGHTYLFYPLEIIIRLLDTNITNFYFGESFALECRIMGNPPPSHLALMNDDEILKKSENINFSKYDIKLIKSFVNVTRQDNGIYKCVGNSSFEVQESGTIEINVFEEAAIDLQIETNITIVNNSLSVTEGMTLPITCLSAGGFPKPTLTILFNGSSIEPETSMQMDRISVRVLLLVTEKVEIKCQVWQDRFGEKVMVQESGITIISQKHLNPANMTLYSLLTLFAILFFITILILIALCYKRGEIKAVTKENQAKNLSRCNQECSDKGHESSSSLSSLETWPKDKLQSFESVADRGSYEWDYN